MAISPLAPATGLCWSIQTDYTALPRQEPSCVTVTNIDVNGTGLFEGLDSVVLDKALQHTHHIYLPHTVNALTIHFSNFDFRNIRSQVYQYYLENVDKGWNVGSSEAKAVYTNLSPESTCFTSVP